MNHIPTSLLAACAACAAYAAAAILPAQTPSLLMTFSSNETSVSGSGGTVLGSLRRNEVHYVEWGGPCTSLSAEKWLPRTCAQTMAGDENGDGLFFRPNVLGRIDALMSTRTWTSPVPIDNQRSIWWSPRAAMDTVVSGAPGLRPGDVGHILINGQVEHFVTQEQINNSLGLPPSYGIDIDAITFQPNFGLFFSIDVDVNAFPDCGPTLVQDGDVLFIPPFSMSYTSDLRIAGTAVNSAVVLYNENDMDAFTASANVADRLGACLSTVGDVEALDIDTLGPTTLFTTCAGVTLPIPNLLFASENGTGASVLETMGGGAIRSSVCGPLGTPCGFGPTLGYQVGIQPISGNIGAVSYVNALASTRVCRFVMEPNQHVMNLFGLGAPMGANRVEYHNPFPWGVAFLEFVAPPVATSVTLPPPLAQMCFPDLFTTSTFVWWAPLTPGFNAFPTPAIPPAYSGTFLFQGLGWSGSSWELSAPATIDVQ